MNTGSVNGRVIDKIFFDINDIISDTMSLFHEFNKSKNKRIKKLLSQDMIYNERLLIYLRLSNNKDYKMEIYRDYTRS